jgi:2-polyprenyl-3-methyl-5-hydroxy-6-metoxy-1,4-benzoquinol methylase
MSPSPVQDTSGDDYARRLQAMQEVWWKKALNVQAPYQWNLRRQQLGRTLDVGCGIGRNLGHLDGNGVGVDHNRTSIEAARAAGLTAFVVEEFMTSEYAVPARFDSMLAAHVVEHVEEPQALEILGSYLPFVKPGGRVVLITPQERGYASDATHVRFSGFPECAKVLQSLGMSVEKQYSFPFPRVAGRIFTYNEFVSVGRKP